MLTLKIECSNHQKNDGGYGREIEIELDTIDATTPLQVRKQLEADRWVVQFNGEHMDTYCSKKCAE